MGRFLCIRIVWYYLASASIMLFRIPSLLCFLPTPCVRCPPPVWCAHLSFVHPVSHNHSHTHSCSSFTHPIASSGPICPPSLSVSHTHALHSPVPLFLPPPLPLPFLSWSKGSLCERRQDQVRRRGLLRPSVREALCCRGGGPKEGRPGTPPCRRLHFQLLL